MMVMTTPKFAVAGLWVLSIVAWFTDWTGIGATALRCIAPFFAVAHVIEYAMNRELFEKAPGSAGHHFLNTFVFGMFHINEARAAVDDAGAPDS